MDTFLDFDDAVADITADLTDLGFSQTEHTTSAVCSAYFFRRGLDALVFYYLPRDSEYNFMVSRSAAASFDYPTSVGDWTSGTEAMEIVRGRPLSVAELDWISDHYLKPTRDILKLFATMAREIVGNPGAP